ncbi:FHA domain-containing serine/threonine-protein kinase [Streptomyces shenzhenensis]|uniref:FHA domain-containing serine/threonine-protein kinase n=1 Tax=Streptomyces shenzhenensis TaxID=943815 RepID=UPI0033D237EE
MTAQVTVAVHTGTRVVLYAFSEPVSCEVGRSGECRIRIPERHRGVSRRHCRLDVDPPRLRVRDLGSSYGTQVNGERLGPLVDRPLADGDEIRVGDVRLLITVSESSEPPQTATAADPAEPALPPVPQVPGYALIRELGRGSQGVVQLARDLASGELVALKQVLAPGPVDDNARFAFRRELAGIRALRHPHIVAFRGGGDEDNAFYFATEYCPGGSLEQLAERYGGTVPVDEALTVVRQVLSGLAYAHQAELPSLRRPDGTATPARGLVHRDVKPANILLAGASADGHPVVKLADFGLAKAFERAGLSGHTRTGALGGTIPFTARAQLIDYKYAGPEVDVWATAACLYWMLTGATPRDFPPGRDPVAVALREPVVPIRERVGSVPPRLAHVIDETLTDTPRITVRTAPELARLLKDAA